MHRPLRIAIFFALDHCILYAEIHKAPWSATFGLQYEETIVSEGDLMKGFTDAGLMVGLLDYRPEKNGPYGRFTAEIVPSPQSASTVGTASLLNL